MFQRPQYQILSARIREPRRFIQIVMGPRQVGKTTLVRQVVEGSSLPWSMCSADNVASSRTDWIAERWEEARMKIKIEKLPEMLLVIDEVQKVRGWSEIIKKLWDEDTLSHTPLKVILLGSSRVTLEKGLADSLAGRFETIRLPHWSFPEMHEAFGFSLEQYVYFGSYPAAAELIGNEERWADYVRSSIVDATINKDILIDTAVSKPALLRQTFELAAAYSGEILSMTKMLGQLQDAGNTTTLASYLNLLSDSGLVCGLQKYAGDQARRRASIPKYQVYNNALKTIFCETTFKDALSNPRLWGRIFESAIGTHIVNMAFAHRLQPYYWHEGNDEVDFVIKHQSKIAALEVKSNHDMANSGLAKFRQQYNPDVALVIGPSAFSPIIFLSTDPRKMLE